MTAETQATWSNLNPKTPSRESAPSIDCGLEGASIPYTDQALRRDLERVRQIWDDVQSSRHRRAIYEFLGAVWTLGAWWGASREGQEYARRARRVSGLERFPRESLFATIIRCTADPAKVDKRTRSKWSRLLAYVNQWKPPCETVEEFVKRHGGINSTLRGTHPRFRP